MSKLQVLVNHCLRRILNIHWPEVFQMRNFGEELKRQRYQYRLGDGMELDKAYTEERTGYHRKRGYGLESAGTTEEREA